jgi:GT2 family glycosyltransferase
MPFCIICPIAKFIKRHEVRGMPEATNRLPTPNESSASDQPEAKVAIIVLNYRNYWDTINCLDSLRRVSWKNLEIIVVDNASENDSLAHIGRHLASTGQRFAIAGNQPHTDAWGSVPLTLLLQAPDNRGYAAGNNMGIRLALTRGAEFVLVLNNDTLVEEGFLGPLVEYMRAHPNVGAAGPMVVDAEGHIDKTCARRRPATADFFFLWGLGRILFPNNRRVRRHTYEGEYYFDDAREVDMLSGSCILFSVSTLEGVGLFDEYTFLYAEELILHERLRAGGLTSAVVPTSKIVHRHGQSVATIPRTLERATEKRSLRYYWIRYRRFPPTLVTALFALGPDALDLARTFRRYYCSVRARLAR